MSIRQIWLFSFLILAICQFLACGGAGSPPQPLSSRNTPRSTASTDDEHGPLHAEFEAQYANGGAKSWEFHVQTAKVGQFIRIQVAEVFQVAGPRECIIRTADDDFIWLQGVKTSGLVNGKIVRIDNILRISGTTTYQTAIGGTNTIFVAESLPSDFESIALARIRQQEQEEREREIKAIQDGFGTERAGSLGQFDEAPLGPKKIEPKPMKPLPVPVVRSWNSADGQFSTEAAFAGMIGDAVKLRKSDGQIVSVPLDDLSSEDQAWIKQRARATSK